MDMSLGKNDSSFVNLRSIIDNIPGHIYWCNQAGVVLGCNEAQAVFFGYATEDDLLGKHIYDLYPAKQAKFLKAEITRAIRESKTITIEEQYTQPKGETFTYFSKKVPFHSAAGETIGVVSIALDISSEKEAQQDRIWILENIIGKMPGHVWWKDRDCRFLGCNDKQAETAGLARRQDIRGKSAYDVITSDQPEKERKRQAALIDAVDRRIMESGKGEVIEEPLVLPNGEHAVYLSHKEPLCDRYGRVVGLIGISIDITPEKDRAKIFSVLAAGIAHELRTPLAAIDLLGGQIHELMADLLKGYNVALEHELIEDPLNPRTQQIAEQAGMRLLRIVRSANMFIDMMLMKVNLEQPKGRKLKKLSMHAAIEESLLTYPLDTSESALIHWDAVSNQVQDFMFMGDQTLFNHIFFNLLKNALHYVKSADRGEIKIWLATEGKHNFLHFMDTGTGISTASLPHIFDAFYTKTTHGTGVGLALCKVIMQEFGGEISCQSIEGQYTHFILKFPPLQKEL